MNVYIGKPIIINDMQGPCQEGFHVPSRSETKGLYDLGASIGARTNSSAGSTNFRTYLKVPFAGFLRPGDATKANLNSSATFFTVDYSGVYAVVINIGTEGFTVEGAVFRDQGCNIRPFKDQYITPTSSWSVLFGTLGGAGIFHNSTDGIISITDGNTGYTIADKNLGATNVYNIGDTMSESNCGKYYQWGNNYGFPFTGPTSLSTTTVNTSDYGPGNYYSSSTYIYNVTNGEWASPRNNNLRGGVSKGSTELTTMTELQNAYIGEAPIDDGIYHNASLGLITLAYQGDLLTIADKDLGSSTLNGYGYMYQWGNNYGWTSKSAGSYSSGITTSAVDASTYGPGNYYNSSTLRMVHNPNGGDSGQTAGYDYWDSSLNNNLWGQITNTYEARRGPCPEGYHIPSRQDILNLRTYYLGIVPSESRNAKTHLYMGGGGRWTGGFSYSGNTITAYTISEESYARYWTSDNQISGSTGEIINTRWLYSLISGTPGTAAYDGSQIKLMAIRPYKDTPALPNSTWTVIYKPN